MESNIQIIITLEEDAKEYKKESIYELASKIQQSFDHGCMRRALTEMALPPLSGKPEGNCYNIASAFMMI